MNKLLTIFILIVVPCGLQAQVVKKLQEGKVSYISSQNVYVKFETTENIQIGDTLYHKSDDQLEPMVVVKSKSSISCLCTPLKTKNVSLSQALIAQEKLKIVKEPPPEESVPSSGLVASPEETDKDTLQIPLSDARRKPRSGQRLPSFRSEKSFVGPRDFKIPGVLKADAPVEKTSKTGFKQSIRGRISAASYSSISDFSSTHRMRYALSFRGDHLRDSRWSVEGYLTFRHTLSEWEEVKSNLSNALKVYALAIKYDISNSSSLTIGRKINPKISNMGAIDGVQFEKKLGNFLLGALVGSRPDFTDYSFNADLVQFGGYISLGSQNKTKHHETTLGFIEQRNGSAIDRRFAYFQHSSMLLSNLNFFTSMEASLYENNGEHARNRLSLSNLYASLRYRFSRKLTISASYDNRKNVIYYESYKNFIDRLIEEETRQGIRLHANYRPFKHVIWGVNASWRFQKGEANLSKNLNSYLTFSRIPKLNLRATLTANFLQTNYLDSKIFGVRLSKEVIKGLVNADLNYRIVDYRYNNSENKTHQNIAGVSLSMKVINKLTFYMYYEGTFDPQNSNFNRFNTKIIQRF